MKTDPRAVSAGRHFRDAQPEPRTWPTAPGRARVCVLLGPTAVGKSGLIEILLPELRALRVEVINADSRQVYRGLDAGTAKPSPRLRRALPHHLIDVVDPDVQFTAGDFVRAADRLVAQIHGRAGSVVIAGGAAFYLWSFLHGLSAAPPADAELRRTLGERMRREGAAKLHRELAGCDPDAAARLPAGDRNRVLRALEVYQLTGIPWSSFRPPQAVRRDYELLIVGLYRERAELYERIDRRVVEMFAAGLAAEVATLHARGYDRDTPGLRSIGYAEFFAARCDRSADATRSLPGPDIACRPPGSDQDPEVCRLIQRNTRRMAKRQITFFRRFPDTCWLPATGADRFAAALRGFLSTTQAGRGAPRT